MRFWRPRLAAGLAPILFGSAAAVVIGHAPAPSPRPADRLAANSAQTDSVVLVSCAGTPQARPGTLVLACDDGNAYLSGLRWTSWGATAVAAGTWHVNGCVPNCAAGTFHGFAAAVTLWGLEPLPGHAGADYYSKITIRLPGKHCYTAGARQNCYPASYTGGLRSTPVSR